MKNLLKSIALMIITLLVIFTACGGGGSDSGDGGGGGEIPVFNGSGLLPDGVNATVTGDSYDCYMQFNSNCMNYMCVLGCYDTFNDGVQALDPLDPDYDNKYEALEIAYDNCQRACYAGCDMTSTFLITITLTNTTTDTVTITLPPGLTFIPTDNGYQPMMIIQEVTITIDSGETVSQCLAVFCLDVGASAPDEEAAYTGYNIVLMTGTGCLPDILEILAGVDFTQLDYFDYQDIQDVIWSCTSYGSIDTEELDFLNNLPLKSLSLSMTSSSVKAVKPQNKCTACTLKKLNLLK